MNFLDIQTWWEIPSIAHFCSLFCSVFDLPEFDIEDFEEALLLATDTNANEHTGLLIDLIVRLLSGCVKTNAKINNVNYDDYLRELFNEKCEEYNFENPLNADTDFQLLPLRTKVTVLWNLCDFRLDQEDVPEQLIRLESDSVRVDPLGYDSNSATYWYFYGTRLYREDKVKGAPLLNQPKKRKKNQENKADSNWQVVCFTEEDWQGLTEKFAKSSNKNERALHEVLNESFLPKIGGLFRKRERDRRVRLVGERQSTRIRIRHEETTREREREEKRLKELAERRKREKAKQAEQKKRDKAEAIIREKALRIQRREEAARAIEEAKREQARVLELHGEHAAERSTGADTSEGEPEEEQRQEESQEESVEEFAGYSEEDEEEGYAGFDLSEEIDISPEF